MAVFIRNGYYGSLNEISYFLTEFILVVPITFRIEK